MAWFSPMIHNFFACTALQIAQEETPTGDGTFERGDMENAMEHSQLSRLPQELRDLIYANVFAAPIIITTEKAARIADCIEPAITEPPITALCRQLRAETLPFFYKNVRFIVSVRNYRESASFNADTALQWLDKLERAKAARITHLKIIIWNNQFFHEDGVRHSTGCVMKRHSSG